MPKTVTQTLEQVSENSAFKLAARVCMILVLPLGGYLGNRALEKLDRTNDSTIRQEETLRNIVAYQIPALALNFDGRFNAQALRLDDNSRRIGKLEDWRLTIPIRGNP